MHCRAGGRKANSYPNVNALRTQWLCKAVLSFYSEIIIHILFVLNALIVVAHVDHIAIENSLWKGTPRVEH